jgi:hypothetical protein
VYKYINKLNIFKNNLNKQIMEKLQEARIVSVSELKTASDSRQFFTIGLSVGFGQKIRTKNIFQIFKKDAQGNNTEEVVWDRGTREEALALKASGATIPCRFVSHRVEEYSLPGNSAPLSTYTAVVFPDENEVTVFAANGHNIVTDDGEVLGNKRAILGTKKPEVALA